jgi:hypothetical protein
MDAGFKSPLIDFFKRGDVARDVRLVAAQGALTPRAHEQLALLVLLVADSDPDVAAAADATLRMIPAGSLASFLARSDVSQDILTFFARRGIQPSAQPLEDVDSPIIDTVQGPEIADDEDTEQSALQRLAAMSVPQKMSRATKGTREERAILIRDPNKIVAVAVMSSPKLTEAEVEAIAKMSNVSDEILRIVAHNRNWMKSYAIVAALVKNPKTPLALSMNLMNRLNDKDMRMLSTNRNIPEVLRTTARKKIVIER